MPSPLRVLVMIAAPTDAPPFEARDMRGAIEKALRSAVAQGLITVDYLPEATENALKRHLAQSSCDVFHFIGHGRSQAAAQYGTLVFEDSTRLARSVNAHHLANLLAQQKTVKVAVLQACNEGDDPLAQAGEAVAERGISAVVTTPSLSTALTASFARAFYAALATGAPPLRAVCYARDAFVGQGNSHDRNGLVLRGHAQEIPVRDSIVSSESALQQEDQPDSAVLPMQVIVPHKDVIRVADASAERERARIAQELERKRAAGEFDLFMCHNSADKPAVKRIALELKALGILPWLDEWELPPGQLWQPLLEQQIDSIKAAAVFVGAAGVGPWQQQELYGFLRAFVSRKSPVIPVLLPDAPDAPRLPTFLGAMTWVDFRVIDPAPLERLIWGVTGERPEGY